jgi:threonine aldolase
VLTSSPPESPAVAHDFASDNHAGIHPEVLAAIADANTGHMPAYGDDPITARVREVIRHHFGERADTYLVFNGTGANVVGLQAMTDRWSAVACTEIAHINTDECGAPEQAGLKTLPIPAPDGKLTPDLLDRHISGWGVQHRVQPKVVSLSQATEYGTLYTAEEITSIAEWAHARGMLLHMDGARLANAAAAFDLPLRALTTDAGVDVLSFGGTKNGLMLGEAVIVLNPGATRGTPYLQKSSMQLASKARFISAQFLALLEGDLWLRNARRSNTMARRLADAARNLPGVHITQPVQANAVFAVLPQDATARLRKTYTFYTWDEVTGEVRWMCSFDTTEHDVDTFATALKESLHP